MSTESEYVPGLFRSLTSSLILLISLAYVMGKVTFSRDIEAKNDS